MLLFLFSVFSNQFVVDFKAAANQPILFSYSVLKKCLSTKAIDRRFSIHQFWNFLLDKIEASINRLAENMIISFPSIHQYFQDPKWISTCAIWFLFKCCYCANCKANSAMFIYFATKHLVWFSFHNVYFFLLYSWKYNGVKNHVWESPQIRGIPL